MNLKDSDGKTKEINETDLLTLQNLKRDGESLPVPLIQDDTKLLVTIKF